MMKKAAKLPQLIGVIQLGPLGGSPRSHAQGVTGSLQSTGLIALKEAQLFTKHGFDGILLENSGDRPFYPGTVPPETIASMTVIAAAIKEVTDLPVGIRVLKEDASAALAIAAVTGCDFIRVSYNSCFAFLLRERDRLHVDVKILVDLPYHLSELLEVHEQDGDGVILQPRDEAELSSLASPFSRLYLEMNAIPVNMNVYASGFIAGSFLRQSGQIGAPLEAKKVHACAQKYFSSKKGQGNKKEKKLKQKN